MDYAYDYDYVYDSDQDNPNEDFELRKITVNPQPPPATSFVFVTGIQLPGAPEACRRFATDFHFYYLDIQDYLRDLCDISSHDREAHGHLHTSAYEARFFDGLRDEEFVESPTFAFFLLPTLRWKIEREVGMGWSRFLIVGLERWLRVAREFISRVRITDFHFWLVLLMIWSRSRSLSPW